jgi:hypothetical protein
MRFFTIIYLRLNRLAMIAKAPHLYLSRVNQARQVIDVTVINCVEFHHNPRRRPKDLMARLLCWHIQGEQAQGGPGGPRNKPGADRRRRPKPGTETSLHPSR